MANIDIEVESEVNVEVYCEKCGEELDIASTTFDGLYNKIGIQVEPCTGCDDEEEE